MGSRRVRDAIELLSSMRFSISLLSVLCIASVIGTVVKQNEPFNNYVNQFGPFWAEVFGQVDLYTVYSAPWFLLILAFLVLSTSLCIARNAPKILVDLRQFKEGMREESLQAFHHKGLAVLAESRQAAQARVGALLAGAGWAARVQVREHGVMIAARKGRPNKIGYLAAHSAIVLICLGGLADGDLVVRGQMLLQGKTPFTGGGLIADVPAQHRLAASNPTFRANLLVPEGGRAGTAVIGLQGGVVLQELPFEIELKRFIVEYYATGMPKLFASEIVVHDRATGQATEHKVEVNKPAFHRGVAIYQSSFDDGGSSVTLKALPLSGTNQPFEVQGRIGGHTELVASGAKNGAAAEQAVTLEFAQLRVINVENLGAPQAGAGQATDVRRVDLVQAVESRLGSGAKVNGKKTLHNVGPSITYRLRDAAGQAREYHNYMAPMELDGHSVFLAGTRDSAQDSFRYLRIPADREGTLDDWMRLKRALDSPAQRERAARRYVALATPPDKAEMMEQLLATTRRALGLFAGVEAGRRGGNGVEQGAGGRGVEQGAGGRGVEQAAGGRGVEQAAGGLQALADFMESNVPEGERLRISEVLLRILSGALFELLNVAREDAGLAPLGLGPAAEGFMTQAVTSLSDSFYYPAPLMFELVDFKQVQASVFQVARAPGKTLVYLGAVALIIGVFVMLYVRDRRLWVWLQADPDEPLNPSRTRISTALSSTRRTLDGDAEFDRIRAALLQEKSP